MAKKKTVKKKVVEPAKVPTKPVAQGQPTIDVYKYDGIDPDSPSTWPAQGAVNNPMQIDPDYLGSPDVDPDNPLIQHMESEFYDNNKNKENI